MASRTITPSPKEKPHNAPKWDWDSFYYYYIRGIDVADLLKLPEYKGLTPEYAHNQISRKGWKKERDDIKQKMAMVIDTSISEDIKRVREKFNAFMLKEVENEMRIYGSRMKGLTLKEQGDRLTTLQELRKVATPALGLDSFDPADENQRAFKGLYAIHVHGNAVITPGAEALPGTPTPALEDTRNDARMAQVMERIRNLEPVTDGAPPIQEAAAELVEDLEAGKQRAANEKKIVRKAGNGKRTLGMPVAA